MTVLAANLVAAGSEDFTPWQQAYTVLELDGVRIGIIGMDTPAIAAAEKADNWAGIDFKTFLTTWQHYQPILEDACDIVIVAAHSGTGTGNGILTEADGQGETPGGAGLYYEGSYENQIAALVENSTGIDVVLGGHTHEVGTCTLTDAQGREVPVEHCGTKGRYLGVVLLTYNKTTGELTVDMENVDASQVTPDEDFLAAMADWEEGVWDNYLQEVIGTAAGDFVSPGNLTEGSAFMDLMHKVQLEATGAQLSIAAPTIGRDDVLIPAGDIRMGQIFSLYVYDNWLYSVRMTGAEIKAWLEVAATYYNVEEDGSVSGGGTFCDTISGEGFSYTLWLGNEPGDRVRDLTWQGEPMDMDATWLVVMNNFRFTGGGHYMEHIDTMTAGDTSRVAYATQFDMDEGEDRGQVRNLVADYIRAHGTIEPVVTSSFHVYAGASAD